MTTANARFVDQWRAAYIEVPTSMEECTVNQHDIDTVTTLRRVAGANDHGPLNTEQSRRNLRQLAVSLDGNPYRCQHDCDVVDGYLPLAAQRLGDEYLHEPWCPLHDDNTPGVHGDAAMHLPGAWGGDDEAA